MTPNNAPPLRGMHAAVLSMLERMELHGSMRPPEMTEYLERESGFRELYDTLARARTRMARYGESVAELDEIDAALAKARGE